jgi:hypothetical protein
MFGIFLVLVQFMQAVLGYSALAAAASLLPRMGSGPRTRRPANSARRHRPC